MKNEFAVIVLKKALRKQGFCAIMETIKGGAFVMMKMKIVMDEDRIAVARDNISRSGYKNIHILEGDAAETLRGIENKEYDFVFIDAAKAQYKIYMEEAIRLSHPGTVIITDNILADGDVLESHFLVEKRDRTIHDRMREYLYMIKNDDRLETAILSVADGIAVSVVK